MHRVTVLPEHRILETQDGKNLLELLRDAGILIDAPCGGRGTCGKCRIQIDGREMKACSVTVNADLTVTVPNHAAVHVLRDGIPVSPAENSGYSGYLLAFDIGTTTVAGYLLDGTGAELASESRLNPQTAWGADVISRIQYAVSDEEQQQTVAIRQAMEDMIRSLCGSVGVDPSAVSRISVAGNPAMQQLFLGIRPDNLVHIPFAPVLTEGKLVSAVPYLPCLVNAELIIVPDISGYVGADTVACVLAAKLDEEEELTLLVDIGTNGELVLGNREGLLACSTAAGPALEGANIRFGMRAAQGAIDHVWTENGELHCSVIGGGDAVGICGSGLIDAVAAALELGLINHRGRIQCPEERDGERFIPLIGEVYLTQNDIREVQMAKGAIAAGIELMADQLGVAAEEIQRVYLAGAFGTFLRPASACAIGLLPPELLEKIVAIGNAAGSGARLLACDSRELDHAERICRDTGFLELASLEDFMYCYAEHMRL